MGSFTPRQHFMMNGIEFVITKLRPEGRLEVEEVKSGAPHIFEYKYLLSEYSNHRLYFCSEKKIVLSGTTPETEHRTDRIEPDLRSYGEQAEIARQRLTFIERFAALPHGQRSPAMERYLENLKSGDEKWDLSISTPSFSTGKRWLKTYLKHDCDVRALVPDFTSRGGPGKKRLRAVAEQIVDDMIKEVYLVKEDSSIDDVADAVLSRINSYNQAHKNDLDFKLIPVPGRSTIHRRIQEIPQEELDAIKYGAREARSRHQQRNKVRLAENVLERCEIDNSPYDLIIEGFRIRVHITVVIDYATKIILGYSFSPHPPSYLTVLECLFCGMLPKIGFKERFHLIHDFVWFGRPLLLAVDGGKDFINNALDDALKSLGITKEQMAGKSPRLKGTVERVIRTIQGEPHKKPGTTFSNPIERDLYDSVAMARLSLEEAESDFVKHIVDVYSQRRHRGIGAIPALEWERKTRFGFFPELPDSPKQLLIDLMPNETRALLPTGIEYELEFYNCEELGPLRDKLERTRKDVEMEEIVDKKSGKRTKHPRVKFKTHPGDRSRIYVIDPFDNHHIIEVPANDPDGVLKNMSAWEHSTLSKLKRQLGDKEDRVSIAEAKEEQRRTMKPDSKRAARIAFTPPSLRENTQNPTPKEPELPEDADDIDLTVTPEDLTGFGTRYLSHGNLIDPQEGDES